jgi:crotonobetainyl-CoA:carnitine CoA-transferase CaiB-like acyl-CoA transferase
LRPLDGIVVLDLTRLLPGAATTTLLSQFGAEIIKVEEPGSGDYARQMPPLIKGEGAFFVLTNYGKKSVAIDLKNPRGKEAFLRLVERADVLIEGFRPGVMQRLGLDFEVLRQRNERLIYTAITGYGQHGPYAPLAGHDINYLSLSGVLGLNGANDDKAPVIPGVQVADLAGGAMQAVIGILLALAARQKLGQGQMVDVAMLDGAIMLLTVPLAHFVATERIPKRGGEMLTGLYACYNIYKTRDEQWVSVGALEPKFWATLCRALDCEAFIPHQFAGAEQQSEMIAALAKIFMNRDAAEWFALLGAMDACVTPVNSIVEMMSDPHVREREMIVRVEHPTAGTLEQIGIAPKLSETPGHLESAPPPRLGEHTREMLRWAGIPDDEINELKQMRVIQA